MNYIVKLTTRKVINKVLILVLLTLSNNVFSQGDLIIGGNLDTYFSYANFEYENIGYTTLSSPFSGVSNSGQNAIVTNPNIFNTLYISSGDHTSGYGQMLVVDGSTSGNNQYFWKGGYNGQGFCGLTIGKVYTFSYWVKSVSNSVTNPSTQADIRVDITNATNISLVSGSTVVSLPAVGWEKVTYTFTATDYCVAINMWDFNTNTIGNDFALDDFSLTTTPHPFSLTYSLTNGNCENGLTLVPYTSGGNSNISSYTLVGPSYYNYNGNFNNLQPGSYVLTVVDVDGNTASVNVEIPTEMDSPLTVSSDETICNGESVTLSVSGSTTGYNWTSSPYDASLINPTSANPTVNPTETTTYTVFSNSNNASGNLIYNGDFSMGNVGFGSRHFYYATNFENAPNAYSVVADPSTWGTNFPNCGDHTTGNGNMLVVNGFDQISDGGGNSFWEQGVTLERGTNYVFSFWVQSLSANYPAALHVIINGSIYNVYPHLAPSSNNCGNWVQYSTNYLSWYEGAIIQITNANYSFEGNDFAIDDITLTTANSCTSESVTITVEQPLAVNIGHNSTTTNSITFDWNALVQATGYQISYSVNNGSVINVGIITTNTFTVNGLSAGDSVNLSVLPIGSGCFSVANDTGNSFLPCPTPVVNITNHPNCNIPFGTITLSYPLGTQYEYSLDGITFQSSPVFSNLVSGNYTVIVRNISTSCQSVSNALSLQQPDYILPDITASYLYQDCAVNLNANTSIANSTIVWNGPGGVLNAPNPVVVNLGGTYSATITDLTTGCTNSYSLNVTLPIIPVQPIVNIMQPSCDFLSGNITVTAPLGNNFEYSMDGINYQTSLDFQNLTPGNYFIMVKDINTSCISTSTYFAITAATIPPPHPDFVSLTLCEDSIVSPLSVTAMPNAIINWYGTNATAGVASTTAPIPDTSNPGTINYYCSQTLGLCESDRFAIEVTITGDAILPDFTNLNYCLGDLIAPLNLISPNGISGTWQPTIIDTSTSGNYTFTPDPNQCANSQTISITINSPQIISFDWIVKEEFQMNQVLTILPHVQGDYLYQLDSGVPQTSPIFENISVGLHTVTVFDALGCSNPISRNDILVINYPRYFTPNNDGINDVWSIPTLYNYPNSVIQIFDRFGKLIKILDGNNFESWDGKYNGQLMPSSDYWFVVNYQIHNGNKTFKANFSLIR